MAFTNQAGTLLGPLTTTWTMPETCSVFLSPCSTCDQGFRAQSCNAASSGRVQDNAGCWPPAKTGIASPTWPFNGWGFYSPGLACPAGYVTACTAVYGQRPQWDTQFTLISSETAVGCCPPGFTCTNNGGNTCMTTATQTTVVPTGFCDGTNIANSGMATFPTAVTITRTITDGVSVLKQVSISTRTVVLFAPMFQLNFQASDLPASTTATSAASTTSFTSSAATNTSSQQSTTSAADGGSSSNSSGGLSSGAKVGLGVGISFGVIITIALFSLIFYYRRSKRAQLPSESEFPNNQGPEAYQAPKMKQSPGQVYEMGVYHAPAELPSDNPNRYT
ncbi:hypothetical protein Trco_004964 [Trichoderma cornu-damae]|uniref:Mid2 domain-containing protein n=1 Tax=Trichoderma cornu-damae TaxID=654480 RepID=A0A9P8TSB8_9HYPO|nr:hypothetical protein Trco_004964 [Trichoderma cornu-damae]